MNWLIDAQLHRRLAGRLNALGHNARHTLDLPAGNGTIDAEIRRIASNEDRIVVSKVGDFLDAFLVTGSPPRLLWVTVGNINNNDLLALFESLLPDLEAAFQQSDCVELTKTGLVVHQ